MTKTEKQMWEEFSAVYGLYNTADNSDMDDVINDGNFRVWKACQRINDAEIGRLREALSALINAKEMKENNYSGYEQAKKCAWETAYNAMNGKADE